MCAIELCVNHGSVIVCSVERYFPVAVLQKLLIETAMHYLVKEVSEDSLMDNVHRNFINKSSRV